MMESQDLSVGPWMAGNPPVRWVCPHLPCPFLPMGLSPDS